MPLLSTLSDDFIQNAVWTPEMNAWVVWDNDIGKAEMVKQIYPYDSVLLYDSSTHLYTPYQITFTDRRPVMVNGVLTFIETEKKI
jgi:hypothetical protein